MLFMFENHDGASLHPEVCAEILERVDRPNIRMNFDPINFERAGVNGHDGPQIVGPPSGHVHLKGLERGEFCEFGVGDVDLLPVLRALVAHGYRGGFTVEYEGPYDGTLRREGRGGQRKRGAADVDGAKLSHDSVHDGSRGTPGENVRQRGVTCGFAFQRCAMDRADRGFGAEQIRRSDLHAGCAGVPSQPQRLWNRQCRQPQSREALPLCTICGTSANVPTWVVRSSDRNMPRCPPASTPCAMMASTPCASSQSASSTVVAEERIFEPHVSYACQQFRGGQAEMKAHHRRPEFAEHVGGFGAERRAPRPAGIAPDRCRAPLDSGGKACATASRSTLGVGGVWQKKLTLNGFVVWQ